MALWVPVTSHCYLEEAGLLKMDLEQCCSGQSSNPAKGDPCDSGCKIVEKAGAKFQGDQKLAVAPVLIPLLIQECFTPPSQPFFLEIVSWPPKALHLTQYVANTALPARAPSFVS